MTRLVCALTATLAVLLAGLTWQAEVTTLMVAIWPRATPHFRRLGACWPDGTAASAPILFAACHRILSGADVIACPVSMRP